MMYSIEWNERALLDLDSLEETISKRIILKVEELKENPFSKNVKKLKKTSYFRLRIGDYRVIFEINPSSTLVVLMVGHRKNIYNNI